VNIVIIRDKTSCKIRDKSIKKNLVSAYKPFLVFLSKHALDDCGLLLGTKTSTNQLEKDGCRILQLPV
jgi:hypothetical protein